MNSTVIPDDGDQREVKQNWHSNFKISGRYGYSKTQQPLFYLLLRHCKGFIAIILLRRAIMNKEIMIIIIWNSLWMQRL